MEVFLGGTANGSQWRKFIEESIEMKSFNPIVEDWNEEAQQQEIEKRESCDWLLYVITPKMEGVYSIAEVTYDAATRPHKTLFCVLDNDDFNEFTEHQLKSLKATEKLIENCGARVFTDLNEVVSFLNYVQNNHTY